MIHNFSEIIQYSWRLGLWFIFMQTQFSSLFGYFNGKSFLQNNKFVIWSTLTIKIKRNIAGRNVLVYLEIASSEIIIITLFLRQCWLSFYWTNINPNEKLSATARTVSWWICISFAATQSMHNINEVHVSYINSDTSNTASNKSTACTSATTTASLYFLTGLH